MAYFFGIVFLLLSVATLYLTAEKTVLEVPDFFKKPAARKTILRYFALICAVVGVASFAFAFGIVTAILGALMVWMIAASLFVLFAPRIKSTWVYFSISGTLLIVIVLLIQS